MSAFSYDHAEDMKNPEYAYQFGRNEREIEIIKLLEDKDKPNREPCHHSSGYELPCGCCNVYFEPTEIISLIKGEK